MEYYEAICILEENESLNFLNYYNIKSDSKYMSKQKKRHCANCYSEKRRTIRTFSRMVYRKKV